MILLTIQSPLCQRDEPTAFPGKIWEVPGDNSLRDRRLCAECMSDPTSCSTGLRLWCQPQAHLSSAQDTMKAWLEWLAG